VDKAFDAKSKTSAVTKNLLLTMAGNNRLGEVEKVTHWNRVRGGMTYSCNMVLSFSLRASSLLADVFPYPWLLSVCPR